MDLADCLAEVVVFHGGTLDPPKSTQHKGNKMKIVRVYLTVKSDAVTVNNIACITYDQVVKAFGKCAKDAGYKSIEDVPKDCWLWQNSSTMDNPEDYTQDKDILNLVELLMNGDKDPRNVIWR